MSKQHQAHDGVDRAVIQTLENNLNELAVHRRCLSAIVTLSVDELVQKVAQTDEQSLSAMLDLLDAAEPVISNMQHYLECLKTAQARLLNAFIQNKQRILDIDTAAADIEADKKSDANNETNISGEVTE